MESGNPTGDVRTLSHDILAYLNLSNGGADGRIRRQMSDLWALAAGQAVDQPWAAWQLVYRWLAEELIGVDRNSAAFGTVDQVQAVLPLVFEQLLPAYRQHHHDLLFQQSDEELFQPFFLARACEAVLSQGPPWDQPARIIRGAIKTLNDFIGYRPVAVLHTDQKIEPYEHEWVCPIPLYFREAGVAAGKYHELVSRAMAVLEATPARLREAAWFDPALLDELSLDPRAYDFDHPVNKRPNYQFGQWDPHRLDAQGRYRRMVLQGVTLDALLTRANSPGDSEPHEALAEAAIALAGTILMASGTSGSSPETHDSSVTLSTLLPRIARYRDAFYEHWLAHVPGEHGIRLRMEAERLRQPFGGTRQNLNQTLSRLRATQLQYVCLAQLFARMGYPEASLRQGAIVPVVSARLLCEIDCRLASGRHALDRGELSRAAAALPEIEDLLRRGIHCGAIIDPWNILGFGGNFSLFPAVENTVHDHRVDVLVSLMERIFDLFARVWREAAASDARELEQRARSSLGELTRWWDQYAAEAVSDVAPLSGSDAWTSASQVAQALSAWRKAGEAAGDVAFWTRHVDEFTPTQAYAQVVEALLGKGDMVASMALLMQWLSQANRILLEEGTHSFHQLAGRWMHRACETGAGNPPAQAWARMRRFFDFAEANAEGYWEPPKFGWTSQLRGDSGLPAGEPDDDPPDSGEDDEDNVYGAAYEGVVYRDSTGDGIEGDMLEGGAPTDFELDLEATRLSRRLAFLNSVALLWKRAAAALMSGELAQADLPDREDVVSGWLQHCLHNRQQLHVLLQDVSAYRIPDPSSDHDSLVEYDRRVRVKESVLESVTQAFAEACDSARHIQAALGHPRQAASPEPWEESAVAALRGILRGDAGAARGAFTGFLAALKDEPLLYVPLVRQSDPTRTARTKSLLSALRPLLRGLPRLGLLRETCQLIDAAQQSEVDHPLGPGAVTEFDRLFDLGARSLVEAIALSLSPAPASSTELSSPTAEVPPPAGPHADADLIDCLETLTQGLLKRWLAHSNNLRLSALERVSDDTRWSEVVKFVEQHGRELFNPRFFNPGNLRAILQQGADAWLRKLEADADPQGPVLFVESLSQPGERDRAATHLRLIMEALLENYSEFRDYNTTTMQSDRGELLHLFLDFLRIKTSYDRVVWNLHPILLVHEVLVRQGLHQAAERWRRTLAERTAEIADKHVQAVADLTRRSGIRLSTVADRVQERFLRPLVIARLKALVRPAIEEARFGKEPQAFEALEQELQELAQHPSGAGLDVPDWIRALQVETSKAGTFGQEQREPDDGRVLPPPVRLTLEEIQRQLGGW
ncbi:MAG: hypothetical protein AB7O62_09225 [Pirellulales bacterium]